MGLNLDGKTYFVAGVWAVTKVVNDQGANLPAFNVGVIVGKQQKGIPYTAGIGASPDMKAGAFILPFSDGASLKRYVGEDSDIATQFGYAKKAGAGTVFVLPVNPFTQLSNAVIPDKAIPTNTMTLESKDYGAHCNDFQLTIATGVHTIVPPKNVSYLTQNAGIGIKLLYVKNASKYSVGQSLYVTDNAAAPQLTAIDAIDAVNNVITVHDALDAGRTTAGYARIFQLDPANQTVSNAITTPGDLVAFYNTNPFFGATSPATGVVPANVDACFIGYVAGATKGTSPEATASDWQAVTDNFLRWNEEFAVMNKIYLRYLLLGTSDAANHAAFSALATDSETVNKPLVVNAGCALGDYLLQTSDSDNPITRAFALNNDRVELAGFGLDGQDAYLTLAAEVFGDHLANPVNHNLSRDMIVAQTVENAYYKDDPAFTTFTQGGVLSIEMTKSGYKLSMGVNTYQDQATVFNQSSKKSYLMAYRNIADFCLRADLEVLDAFAGADNVTEQTVTGAMLQTGKAMKEDYQYISDYVITSITHSGNAWTVVRTVTMPGLTDQIGLVSTIYVPD